MLINRMCVRLHGQTCIFGLFGLFGLGDMPLNQIRIWETGKNNGRKLPSIVIEECLSGPWGSFPLT
jgi:hypothetical protein